MESQGISIVNLIISGLGILILCCGLEWWVDKKRNIQK